MTKETVGEQERVYNKDEVKKFLTEIDKQITSSKEASLHSIVALNELLRLPNAVEIFDEELKTQCRELWTKLKESGLQLSDPPLLFGLPERFGEEEEEEEIVVEYPHEEKIERTDIN